MQKILQLKSMSVVPSATTAAATVKALVLVPSKELSQQATKNIKVGLLNTVYCMYYKRSFIFTYLLLRSSPLVAFERWSQLISLIPHLLTPKGWQDSSSIPPSLFTILSHSRLSLIHIRALQDKPDIVVGTPSRVLTHLQNKVNMLCAIHCWLYFFIPP